MVHRSADSRLLDALIHSEKEYTRHLRSLLDISHASFNSLTAYAASSPPPASQIILSIAGSLSNADNALRGYAAAVEEWARYLKQLKDLEDEVGNIMRDREILVTRLLKASKSNTKPSGNRDSFILPSSPPASSSTLSLKSNEDPSTTYASTSFFSNLTSGPSSSNKKMQTAQAELQACETFLAKKELELEGRRSSTIHDGLRVRFSALGQTGCIWQEVGKEVEVVLGFKTINPILPSAPSSNKPLPDLHAPVPVHAKPPTADFDRPSSDLSSIAPSQSASQIGLVVSSPLPFSHIYSELEAASRSPSSTPANSSQAHGEITSLHIPPAHSIDDLTLPVADVVGTKPDADTTIRRHVLPHRITEEDLGFRSTMLGGSSSALPLTEEPETQLQSSDNDTDEEIPSDARVVENPRFSSDKASTTIPNGRLSSSPTKTNGKVKESGSHTSTASSSGSRFFGTLRGLFHRNAPSSTSVPGTGDLTDNESIDGLPGKSRKKSRKGLLGKNKKTVGNSDDEGGSIMSSPPAPLRHPNSIYPSSSTPSTPPRGRTVSEIRSPAEPAKRLKKTGPGVGPRGKTVTNTLADGELKRRRRSASLDYGDLSVKGRDRGRSRAEEWVDGQQQDLENGKPAHTYEGNGPAGADVTKKASVKRRKSNRQSMTTSASALVLPSSSNVIKDTTPIRPSPASVSRNSSIKSSASSPVGGSSGRVMTSPSSSVTRVNTHHNRVGSVDMSSSHTSPASSSVTLTPNNVSSNLSGAATKSQRRASYPVVVGPGTVTKAAGEGSASLMSIVEGVTKANREAWNNSPKSNEASSQVTMAEKTGNHIALPLEFVKAPKSIDLEDLKDQMDKDFQSQRRATSLSSSASAPVPRSSHDRETIDSSVSAPLLPAVPVVLSNAFPTSKQGQIVLPLRSALKNPSRTPSPMLPSTQTSSGSPSGSLLGSSSQQQTVRAPSPLATMVNGDIKGKGRADPLVPLSPPPSTLNSPLIGVVYPDPSLLHPHDSDPDSDSSDAASISSYETGHEMFEKAGEDSGEDTETGQGPPTPPPHDLIAENRPLQQPGTSESITRDTITNSNTAANAMLTSAPPTRRKSVRVSLQPMFSTTPPAIEYEDEEEPSWNSREDYHHSSGTNGSQTQENDIWADSSDEDVEYKQARILLNRFSSRKDSRGKAKAQR